MSLNPGVRLGPYEIEAVIGSGGMGEVYRARDVRLGRAVAIKLLRRSDIDVRASLEREARLIASINHPHICSVYDIGTDGDTPFLVMEYVEGETLGARLARGRLPLDETQRTAIEIAHAIDAAHRRGVIHRDLKPANVMLTRTGAKLLDFGLARTRPVPVAALVGGPTAPTQSMDSVLQTSLAGTLPYMAPEQLDGREADARSDIFSFGVVLYEMTTGRRAFAEESPARVIHAILGVDPPPLAEVRPETPPALERIVRTCLAKDPEERWQDARDLVRALDWVPQTPQPVGAAPTTGARGQRWVLPLLMVAVLAVLAQPLWRASTASAGSRHVVVLPCRVVNEPADRHYCDGLAETLTAGLTRLSATHDLQVTPASRVRQEGIETARDARERLGATLALEGSLLRAGETLRLNYALVDTATLQQLDAVSLTARTAEPFALQDQIGEWATRVLELRLSAVERRALRAHGTQSAEAFALYQQGRGHLRELQTPEQLDTAIGLLTRAVEHDPRYAAAHAALGESYWRKYETTRDPTWIERARDACAGSLSLDASLALPYTCLGAIYNGTGRYDLAVDAFRDALARDATTDESYLGLGRAYELQGDALSAERTYRQAIDLRPHYWAGHTWLANFHLQRGRLRESLDAYEHAAALSPANALVYARLGGVYMYLGRYDEALTALRTSVAIVPTYLALGNWGTVLYRLRDHEGAARMFTRACTLQGSYQCLGNLGRAYHWANRRDEARALLERAVDLALKDLVINPRDLNARLSAAEFCAKLGRQREALEHVANVDVGQDAHQMFFIALVHLQVGDRTAALDWLSRAVEANLPIAELAAWTELDVLRNEPGFTALLGKTRGN